MVLVFTLERDAYALPLTKVQEIIRYTPPPQVPSTTQGHRGVLSLRGTIISVVDLAARLGVRAQIGENTRIVIVAAQGTTVGIIVDHVDEVLAITRDQVDNARGVDPLVSSIAHVGDRLAAVIDADIPLTPGDPAA